MMAELNQDNDKKSFSVSSSTILSGVLIAAIIAAFSFIQSSNSAWAVQAEFNKGVLETLEELKTGIGALDARLDLGTSDRYTAKEAQKDNMILELKMKIEVRDEKIERLEKEIEKNE